MKILCIGDVVSDIGIKKVQYILPVLIKEYSVDFVIANGENANPGNGICRQDAEDLHYCGVDIITTGNHVYRQKSIYDFLDDCSYIIRPANFASESPGKGYIITDTAYGEICVINLIGQVYMDKASDNPFRTANKILNNVKADFYFVDFHAEATSEKRAMGYWLDGRVNCVYGTHTHVQTADEQILPKGTLYITDIGMTGAAESVLGVDKDVIINKFVSNIPAQHKKATLNPTINAIIADTDNKTIERICR